MLSNWSSIDLNRKCTNLMSLKEQRKWFLFALQISIEIRLKISKQKVKILLTFQQKYLKLHFSFWWGIKLCRRLKSIDTVKLRDNGKVLHVRKSNGFLKFLWMEKLKNFEVQGVISYGANAAIPNLNELKFH